MLEHAQADRSSTDGSKPVDSSAVCLIDLPTYSNQSCLCLRGRAIFLRLSSHFSGARASLGPMRHMAPGRRAPRPLGAKATRRSARSRRCAMYSLVNKTALPAVNWLAFSPRSFSRRNARKRLERPSKRTSTRRLSIRNTCIHHPVSSSIQSNSIGNKLDLISPTSKGNIESTLRSSSYENP